MDHLQYTHSGKIWRSCPTAGEGDCFFHSVFGTRDGGDGVYRDKYVKRRRMNWSMFLTHHNCGGTPTGALRNVLSRCFTANDNYQHRGIDNLDDYTNYANTVFCSDHWVLVEEIPILATLENVKIVLFRDAHAEPMVFAPNLELLGDFPSRNINEIGEVAICLVDGHFSRLNPLEQPIATSVVDKSNSVKEEATARQSPQKTLKFNRKRDYPKLGSAGILGSLYQINLLTMVLLNATQKVKCWRLSTEHKEASQFDDLIFESLPSESAILLQAKHKEDEKKEVTIKELMSVNKKNLEFSLPKYFISYQEVKRNFQVQNIIICTNLGIDEETKNILKEENVDPDSVLHFEGAENICYGFSGCLLPELNRNIKTYHTANVKNIAISDEDINDYLNHLKFFPNCLGDKNVDRIIQQIISRIKLSENLSSDTIQKDIHKKMTDWFKEKKGKYLTEMEAKAFFCDMRSNKYCEDLKLYKISFKNNNLPFILQVQQKNENKSKKSPQQNENDAPAKRISHIIPDKEYLLNVVKTYLALPTRHKHKTLFVDPAEAFEVQKQIIDAFEVPHYTILVMVCLNHRLEDSAVKEMCDKVTQALKTHKYKHVILIAEEKNNLATQLIDMNINNYEVITDSITFADLQETTQEEFKRKRLINFQGSIMSLEELFTPSTEADLNEIVSSELLIKLARDGETQVGQELPHPDNYYISRSFNQKDKHLSEEELWCSTEAGEEKIILISDSAGMGKSCVLTNLANSIKRDYPHLWVIRLDLNNYTKIMKETLAEGRKFVSIVEVLDSQDPSKIKSEFGRKLLSTPRRVVLMLDGVDEISPTYTELVINLIRYSLLQDNLTKIFVTTRPHMSKDFIEIPELQSFTLESFSKKHQEETPELKFFTLEPFSKLNQINFLIRYWTETLRIQDDVRRSKCNIFAEALIENISKWIKEKNRNNFAGIPLQTRMLAEIFQEKYPKEQEWEGCKEFLSSGNKEPKLPTRIDLTQLYEMFIDRKREIFITTVNPDGHSATDEAYKPQLEMCQKYHCALALKEIFDSDKWDLFTCYTNVEWPIPSTFQDNFLFRMGIVQGQGENFEFLHRTFAEYFVIDGLLNEVERKPINEAFQQFFIESIMLDDKFYVIRAFLESRMTHVEQLIRNNFRDYFHRNTIREESLRSYFYVFAEEGSARIFASFIKCIEKEQREILSTVVNDVISLTVAVRFATLHGHLEILKLLLELNQTFNTGKEAHKQFLSFVVIDSVNQNFQTFKFLSRKVDDIDENILGCLAPELHGVFIGRFGKVELWMEKAGTEGNVNDNIRGSMVHRGAVSMSQLEVVKFWMEQIRADINTTYGYGQTALHAAAGNGELEIIQYLVEEARADIYVKDNNGWTALHLAAKYDKLEIIKYLVKEAGADINVKNYNDRTPLHMAAREGKLEIFKYVVEEAEADINVTDTNGWTALHVAAGYGQLEIVKYLVEETGADINAKNNSSGTAHGMWLLSMID